MSRVFVLWVGKGRGAYGMVLLVLVVEDILVVVVVVFVVGEGELCESVV